MAEEHPKQNGEEPTCRLQIPTGRVMKIMKLDKEVKKVNSEALFLISRSAELFLEFLADKSAEVAVEKKKKTVKLEHLRVAVKRHRPTSDFLLDSLPMPPQPSHQPSKASRNRKDDKPIPRGTRKIDAFFQKCT